MPILFKRCGEADASTPAKVWGLAHQCAWALRRQAGPQAVTPPEQALGSAHSWAWGLWIVWGTGLGMYGEKLLRQRI